MGQKTDIEWADSSINLMMGCNGCELWNPKAGVKHCYAGTLTDRYGGRNKGFPASFDQPKLFVERIDAALRWPDLTGKKRPDKPWLDGRPRMIFLNDMGDTFTESLPLDWLAPLMPRIEASPHWWMLLTKRANRMRDYSKLYPFPPNVLPGVSITTERTLPRLTALLGVRGGGWKWVSAEPLLGEIRLPDGIWCRHHQRFELTAVMDEDSPCFAGQSNTLDMIELCIIGGESGPDARPCNLAHIRAMVKQCQDNGVKAFVKQLGACPEEHRPMFRLTIRHEGIDYMKLKDPKGGDPAEWPADLNVREIPEVVFYEKVRGNPKPRFKDDDPV